MKTCTLQTILHTIYLWQQQFQIGTLADTDLRRNFSIDVQGTWDKLGSLHEKKRKQNIPSKMETILKNKRAGIKQRLGGNSLLKVDSSLNFH